DTEELAGLTFCGVPYLLYGRNLSVAWGMVNAGVSVQDLYVERFNPNNPLQFDDHGTWQDAVRFREVIRVRGARPQQEDVLVTRRGPVISPAVPGTHPSMSLRWTGFDSEVDSISWARRLNLATDWRSFRAAVSSCAAPAMGVTYADTSGNIGYRLSGFVPTRRPGQGRVPSRGWARDDEWLGFVALEEMPELFNPASGQVVAANQPVAVETCPHALVFEDLGGARAARIESLLAGRTGLAAQDCAAIQADLVSVEAVEFLALVAEAVRYLPVGHPTQAVTMLRAWDGAIIPGSAPAALYEAIRADLFERVAGARMSAPLRPLAADAVMTGVMGVVRAGVAAGDSTLLWDALRSSWATLERQQGPDPRRWSIAGERRFTFTHALAETLSALGPVLSRGPFEVPGDRSTVRVGWVASGRVTSAFYRAVYDLGQLPRSAWISAPGQSGHPASPHYADTVPRWLRAELEPMAEDPAAPGGHLLVLRPAATERAALGSADPG
ncbi:MAG: penicillin acylase family protein, partial [Candidatus Dormibacteria bacterium]